MSRSAVRVTKQLSPPASPPAPAAPSRVPIPGPLQPARFVERPNRFVVRCRVEAGDEVVDAHLADPGRLRELLVPGRRLWLRPASDPSRSTRWSAVLVERPAGPGLVSVDTTLPNRLIGEALRRGGLPELAGWSLQRAEWRHGRSRIDFLLADRDGGCLALEVKSVTLVEDGVGLFPDAVTARGARHVRELAELAARPGWAAAVLFVVQRDDVDSVTASPAIDPAFAVALADARAAGVRVLGRRCHIDETAVVLGQPIPVV